MNEDSVVPIASRADFHRAVRAAVARATAAQSREIVMSDPSFADWPLDERELIDALARWVGSRCTMTLFADGFDELARRHTRFVAWRQAWSHVVHGRSDPELGVEQIPVLLLVPGEVVVRLVDRERYRGTVSTRPTDLAEARGAIDALLQRSSDAFPATTLGL